MSLFSTSRAKWLALAILAVLFLPVALYELMPGQRLKAKQEALLKWAHDGKPADFGVDFAAADYSDQWNHTPADVAARLRTARFAFPAVTVEAAEPEIERDGDTATIRQELTVRNVGETLKHTFHFTWRRESFWPWSWRLRRVEAPDFRY